MTAEVAIINRVAVALAADSAMTLSGGGSADKIYNTADKIFELSRHNPIGLMIFNNLDFMGVPLDVAIKAFRDSDKFTNCTAIEQVANQFFDFLLKDIGADQMAQQRYVTQIAAILFRYVRYEFDVSIERMVAEHSKKGKVKGFEVHKLFTDIIASVTVECAKLPVAAGFEDVSIEALGEMYQQTINDAAKSSFDELPINDEDHVLLRKMVATYLHQNSSSNSHTGFVFAGYAGNDLFPSLVSYEVDGIIAGRIKKRKTRSIVINRTNEIAEIVPFAQHDMADRFLYGIDPDFESEIPDYLENAMRATGEAIIKESVGRSRKKAKELSAKLDKAVSVTVREFREKVVKSIKEVFKRQIQGMVSFMPKQELADFAESLVDITSIKRRVSAEQETVGGPVDVAVISRSDGFVWVHRKHYFNRELNPRYFSRKFGAANT